MSATAVRGGRSAAHTRILGLDRFEAAALAVFTGLSLVVLGGLATRPLTMTGADSGLVADQLQYFAWIRSASGHGVIGNLFDIDPGGTSYFVHPGFLLSGLLHRAGLGIAASYQLLWKPVAIAVLFGGFLLYVRRMLPPGRRRHAALVLALFTVSPIAAVIGLAGIGSRSLREQVDFITGEMFPGLYMWGYMMTAIAVGLMPLVLLAVERARVPEWRAAGRRGRAFWAALAAAGGFLVAWLQPWSAVALLLAVGATELVLWRRPRRSSPGQLAATLGPLVAATAVPLAYYLWMSRVDPSWELAGNANREQGNWAWWAWVIGLAPLGVPAALAYRLPAPGWQDVAVRVLPFAMVAEYFAIELSGAGTFPFHSIQGMSLPLAILAVAGLSAWPPLRALRAQGVLAPWMAWAAVALLVVPGVAYKLNNTRIEVHKGGQPYFWTDGERAAFDWLERAPAPGGVMAPIYSGLGVPYMTGRESWVGQVSWTPDFDERRAAAGALFAGRLDRARAIALVRRSGVRFLYADCLKRADLAPLLRGYLTAVRRFGCASVYELDTAALGRTAGNASGARG